MWPPETACCSLQLAVGPRTKRLAAEAARNACRKRLCLLPADADAALDGTAAVGAPEAAAAAPRPGDQAPLLAPYSAPSNAEVGAASAQLSSKQWTVLEVAAELQGYLLAVALDFLVTLAVFPGVASSICPSQNTARRPPCTPHPQAGRSCGKHLGL